MSSSDIFASPKDKYEILRELGHGAFGNVYLANHTPPNSTNPMQVAVKEIARNYSDMEKCKKEGELLNTISKSFTSEHVVKYIDSFTGEVITVLSKRRALPNFPLTTKYILPKEDGKLFIAMEFCSGGDFASKIKEKIESGSEFDYYTILDYMSQIVDGIDELHIRHKIVHRDLKSANILIKKESGREILKISDLGLAKLLDYDTVAANYPKNCHYGTPLYWAPEQEKRGKNSISC